MELTLMSGWNVPFFEHEMSMVLACPMIQRPLVCLLAALWAFSLAH